MGFFVHRLLLYRKNSTQLTPKPKLVDTFDDGSSSDETRAVDAPPSDKDGGDQHSKHDVWYRKFLKPLSRAPRRALVTYRDAFARRHVRLTGIPIDGSIGELHAMFAPTFHHYSPWYGMIFAHNNLIDNLYRYGDSSDPCKALVQELFHMLPGGEIQPTHLGGKAAAHLSSSSIGELIEVWEHSKGLPQSELAEQFHYSMVHHDDFCRGAQELDNDVLQAEQTLQILHDKDNASAEARAEIKRLEGDIVKPALRNLKRIEKMLAQGKHGDREKALAEMATYQQTIDKTTVAVERLREQIVTSADFKAGRKALKRAQDMVEQQQVSLHHISDILARSFTSETDESTQTPLPHATVNILLAFMWRKYDSRAAMRGYFDAMLRLDAIQMPVDVVEVALQATHDETLPQVPHKARKWTTSDAVNSAVHVLVKTDANSRPPIVEFSYIRWADYSAFPDCGETALRNLINHLVYDPGTGRFSHSALQQLKDTRYPLLHDKLIDFYRRNPHPSDAADHEVSREFLDVVCRLNDRRQYNIRYRRDDEQANIASPLANLLQVFKALFGDSPNNDQSVAEVATELGKILQQELKIDTSRVKLDGFGSLLLSVGDDQAKYELQSYKPVHFGFVQVENRHAEQASRNAFGTFRRALHYITREENGDESLEKLALASLMAPFQLHRSKPEPFFDHLPIHVWALFVDLDTDLQRRQFLDWVMRRTKGHSAAIADLAERIRQYKEPSFLPPSKTSKGDGIEKQ